MNTLERMKSEIEKASNCSASLSNMHEVKSIPPFKQAQNDREERSKRLNESYAKMDEMFSSYEERKRKYEIIDKKINASIDQMMIEGIDNANDIKKLLNEMVAVYERK